MNALLALTPYGEMARCTETLEIAGLVVAIMVIASVFVMSILAKQEKIQAATFTHAFTWLPYLVILSLTISVLGWALDETEILLPLFY
jgi:hypothetical protein